jgi:hypothetical protein
MSEEQEKPKLNGNIIPSSGVSKIALLITIFVVLVIAAIGIMSIGGNLHPANYVPYNDSKDKIQNAVTTYKNNYSGNLPIMNCTYTNDNCSQCKVINMSALLTANGGTLQHIPDGLNLDSKDNDNCGGDASLGCNNRYSYIWIVNSSGTVFSYCAGVNCQSNDSGYQGTWP